MKTNLLSKKVTAAPVTQHIHQSQLFSPVTLKALNFAGIKFPAYYHPIMVRYGFQWTKCNLQQEIHSVSDDDWERVVLISTHKIDVEEDTTL